MHKVSLQKLKLFTFYFFYNYTFYDNLYISYPMKKE